MEECRGLIILYPVACFQYSIRVFLHVSTFYTIIENNKFPLNFSIEGNQGKKKRKEIFIRKNRSIGNQFQKNREIRLFRSLVFVTRREIRNFFFFFFQRRIHSSRFEKSRILNWKVFTQGFRTGGSWHESEDGRQLARLGSFSYGWQPVPGEIFYLKKGMEIFLPSKKEEQVCRRSPPTARYFLVFRPTPPGDLVT